MPEITEIAFFPWKADAKDSDAAATLKSLRPQLQSRPGLLSSWYGAPLERPQSAEFVNGSSLSPISLPQSPR